MMQQELLGKLDKLDLRILQLLQGNSKITNLDLSKTIGLSPAPTLERVKKLEQIGVIESYHAFVNATSMGLKVQTFILGNFARQKFSTMEEFSEKIREIEEIVECYFITGEADFMMKVVCLDIPSYEKLLFQKISQIKEIERVRTLMTLSTVKSAKILPFEYN
jgi:DNA-binding Lrp family transcriptional regulator